MIKTDVVIVGLGPVGATLANLLGQQGFGVLAIERETCVYPLPRAAHFDAEIMRVWQGLGLLTEAMAASRRAAGYEFRNAAGEILLRYDLGDVVAPSGFAPAWMFNQPDLERALRAKLADYPTVEARIGVRLETLAAATSDAVRVTIVDPQGIPRSSRRGTSSAATAQKVPCARRWGSNTSTMPSTSPGWWSTRRSNSRTACRR